MIRLSRFGIIHSALVVFAAALLVRCAYVQIWQGRTWERAANRQHFKQEKLPAPRGDIVDASGAPLVESRQRVVLGVAPVELTGAKDVARVEAQLTRLGVSAAVRKKIRNRRTRWVPIPGRFLAVDADSIMKLRGVHAEATMERSAPASAGLRGLIGRVDNGGMATHGLERALDRVLRGEGGTAVVPKDKLGRTVAASPVEQSEPRAGNTVQLTLDGRLQDIAERALMNAVDEMGARAGDIVVLDPNSGEIRALASYQADNGFATSAALTEVYEPGSTIKPLIVSRLISLGLAAGDEVVDTYDGRYEINGRVIEDDHPAARLTLADVIAKSSNVGMVRVTERLTPGALFETLRDFGFGMPTGLPYPGEASGLLRAPRQWSRMSQASLAMGYELAVTSVQLAAAYAAIANGGELLEPTLVREIRTPEGETIHRHERRVVRRLMEPAVAKQVRDMLIGVVESGTAQDAMLEAGLFAGKTGTARLTLAGRGYTSREHLASFVGMFPADKPQLVILVKLVNPRGSYGGRTAAPVSKQVIEAAIAARSIALGGSEQGRVRGITTAAVAAESTHSVDMPVEAGEVGSPAYVIALDSPTVAVRPRPDPRPIPDVARLPLRDAVYELHRAGFRVRLTSGAGRGTSPAPGTLRKPGTVVELFNHP